MRLESSIYIDLEGERSAKDLRQWFRNLDIETDERIIPLQHQVMRLNAQIRPLELEKQRTLTAIEQVLAEDDPVLGRKYWLLELEKRRFSADFHDGYGWDDRFDQWAKGEDEEYWTIGEA